METLPAGAPTLKRPPAKGAKGAPASVADTATVIAPRKPSAAGLGSSSDAATMLKASGPGPQTGAAAADEAGSAPPSSASTGLAKGELRTVGPYRIVKVLGRGGMGVVYKAMDTRLGRTVALKVLRTTGDAHPDEIARFKLEAQNAAKLQHPNIVPIHDTGTVGDLDYFTMDYIEGGTLSQWVREKKPALAKRVAMLVKVASAIQHAHEQNVIHRDLKPANVMVDKQGEPHVMDFGLARNIGTAQGLTVSGTALGTPQYMPPEQAKGSLKEVGPHSDIWALGAVLYELLCGKTPFQGETVFQILRAVVQDDPVPPRKLVRNLPRDLDTICLKCLEKDAARRYASAAALADDLQAHLDGDAISARPLSRVEQAWRATRKRPVLATCAALLLVFGGVAVWLLQSTSATTRAGALGHEIAASLPDGVPTTAELQLLDGRCEELEALDKNAAIAARREINKRFAEALGRQVRALRLEAAELPAVETNLKVLAGRDPAVGAALEKEYRQHLASWDILFELVWPFKDLAAVFDEKLARTDAGGLYGATMKKSPAGPLLATRIDAGGNTRLEAGFAGWQDAAQLGVGLKSDG
ncbi:MAG: serine/threonine-protein kinase, partial [Planctomycetota bacterium]